ncbi:MAG: hypothetical protein F7C36_05180 [Desulfurococcales archaeon]|nr:hypothetical protein [Desulfurococcales archaeon]
MSRILEAQGIEIEIPYPFTGLRGDIAVFRTPRDPEFYYYIKDLDEKGIPYIVELDPLRAISLSLIYPRSLFFKVVIGIDPGDRCGLVLLGDGVLLYSEKVQCNIIGERIRELSGLVEALEYRVYIGGGTGIDTALSSLENKGIKYRIVEEYKTTKDPSNGPITSLLKDKDLVAGYTIAVRGESLWATRL